MKGRCDNINYFIKIGDDWHLFKNCASLRDAVIMVADFTSNNSPLFHTAIINCSEDQLVDMYNVFADSYESITGVWRLGDHLYIKG